MRFFSNLYGEDFDRFFYRVPIDFNKFTERELLSYSLGATLYMPATRPNIHQELIRKKHSGLTSLVICLEDAIGDEQVETAERQLVYELNSLYEAIQKGYIRSEDLPLLFIRIRGNEQLTNLFTMLEESIQLLTGIVIPKFSVQTGKEILQNIQRLNSHTFPLYALPILETKEIIYKETRLEELVSIKNLLDQYKEIILNVRIGATDFSGLFGIRRNSDTTVYDISVIRDCISDIINLFNRSDSPYVVSGPVWEYFSSKERMLKPQIRQTPFKERFGEEGLEWRKELIGNDMDGFLKEILMDIANGIVGKTIIHPTHIHIVQALNVVSYEEYIDACSILNQTSGNLGVMKSSFSNKMNEIKPHYYWAKKILLKSQIYGVLHNEFTYLDLLKQDSYISNTTKS